MLKFLVLLTLFGVSRAQQLPVPNKVYGLRSTMDGGLLFPKDNGNACGLSDISFRYLWTPPYAERYHWRVSVNSLTGLYEIHPVVASDSSQFNELTYEDISNCVPTRRWVELIEDSSGIGFIIRNIRDNKCLYSYGSEVGITIWRDCNEPYGQSFIFLEL